MEAGLAVAIAASTAAALLLQRLTAGRPPAEARWWHLVWLAFIAVVSLASAAGLAATADGSVLMWGALAVSVLLLLQLVAGWWRVRRIARLADPPAAHHAARLRSAYGLEGGRPPRFLMHPRLQTALTWGWRAPVVMLPSAWAGWPPDRLDAVVRHELAHVARRDYLTSLLAATAGAVLWFLPGLWIARRQLRWQAELAADEAAADAVGRELYARHLMAAAGMRPGDSSAFRLQFAPGQVTLVNRAGIDRTELRRRVAALIGEHPAA